MSEISIQEVMQRAYRRHLLAPGFNIPYLPMMKPVVEALRDCRCFGLVMVARLEWVKFEAGGIEQIRDEYERVGDRKYTRLHLDHVPVVDEDGKRVDFQRILSRAVEIGYDSVMVDGSRLPFAENVSCTRQVVDMAHSRGVAVEGELGAVLGHEEGPLPSYEELFASGLGFTDPREASDFASQAGVDWLSVAVGSIHGAVSKARRSQKKVEARLNLEHLSRINEVVGRPLVLHGGTGIRRDCLAKAVLCGISKINVGTALRQAYEQALPEAAEEAVYAATVQVIKEELGMEGSAEVLGSNRLTE